MIAQTFTFNGRVMTIHLDHHQEDLIKKIVYSIHPLREKRLCVSYLERLYNKREQTKKEIYQKIANLNAEQINQYLNELKTTQGI